MDANALRALQAPLKGQYRENPDSAVVTLKARGALDDAHIACKVETGRALAVAGLHPRPAARARTSARATCCSRRWSPARA